MANQIRIGASVNDQVSSKLDRIRDKFDQLGKGAASSSLIGNAGAMLLEKGVSLVGTAADRAVRFIGDSIQAASNLSESLSKSNVVFGQAAGRVEAWSKTTADGFGLSQRAALEAASTYGNFFVGLGQSEDAAASMSTKLVELAGDLASFNNLDPTETLDKLRAGLAGEAEPLRRVGVFLTAAKVQAKAMEMGLADANGEVSESAKVMARYQIILDETKTSQGDFARTSDGLANEQRKANAKIEEAMASMGAHMEDLAARTVPLLADAMGALATGVDIAADAMEAAVGPAKRLMDSADDKYWYLLGDGAKEAAYNIDRGGQAMAAHAGALNKMSRMLEDEGVPALADTEAAAKDYSDAIKAAATATDKSTDRITTKLEAGSRRVVSSIRTVIDDAYRPLVLEAEIAASKIEVADAKQEASKRGLTKAEKAEANLRLVQAQEHYAQLLGEQAAYQSESAAAAFTGAQFTSQQIHDGMLSKDPEIRQAWADIAAIQAAELLKTQRSAYTGGKNTTLAYADGLKAGFKVAEAVTNSYISKMSRMLIGNSPPPEGPLHNIDKGGENVGRAWFEGITKGLGGDVSGPLSRMASMLSGAPSAAMGGLSTAMGAVGGSPVTIPVYLDGRMVAELNDRNLYYLRGARGYLPSG